jgi:4-diphosphocytidyl-2-C-methyl-D-erythritol kinase
VSAARVTAPAKINLCLILGPVRGDGRHELVTLLQSVSLADELTVSESASGHDEVVCAGVEGPNLVSDALAGLRTAGWVSAPLRVEIEKRIPVAAGMGGGSADAAALLRHALTLAPLAPAAMASLAAQLGSDVPSQLDPGPSLGTGAGEIVSAVPALPEHAVLVLPADFGLSTPDVYREADRLGLPRPTADLDRLRAELEGWLAGRFAPPPPAIAVNDLEPAALSLRPELETVLAAAREAGADRAIVCGSGPTVIGVFWGSSAFARASAAADAVRPRFPGAVAVEPLSGGDPAPAANP